MPLSVVVPVFNSERTLPELAQRLDVVLNGAGMEYELILVNDCSRDHSWEVITELSSKRQNIVGINLMRNYGQHNALLCGIRAAQYETIVTLDDDLQHPPEEVPKLLVKLEEGYDAVYGTPDREQHGLWRNVASRVTKFALQSAMGAQTASRVSAFRAFQTCLRDAFATFRGPFVSIDTLLTWGTTRFAAVVVHHDPRRVGSSNYTFRKLLTHWLNMMTGFSIVPLQIATYIGFGFTMLGFIILFWVILRFFLEGDVVPGFPFLASIIVIFSGAQLFALGIIGEYLARMHVRISEAPPYAVREMSNSVRMLDPKKGEYSWHNSR